MLSTGYKVNMYISIYQNDQNEDLHTHAHPHTRVYIYAI